MNSVFLILLVGYRVQSIIGPGFMASHITVSTGLSFCKLNGEHPVDFSVGHLASDMLLLIPRMYFMACLAASAFLPVHMGKMEIYVSIAKISQGFCICLSGYLFIVAPETHGIIFYLVREVEVIRKKLHEMLGIVCCMGIVACDTITLFNRSMKIGAGKNLFFHCLMAGETEVLSILSQSLVVV